MNIEKTLKENKIVVFVVSNKKYSDKINEISNAAAKGSKHVIYVTLNKPYNVISESFEKRKIDTKKMTFIDAASGGVKKPKDRDVVFVSSPKALTELSITVNETMKKNPGTVIFDSLSTLLVYEDASTVVKFVHSIITKIREVESRCVMVALQEDEGKNILKDVSMFVDKVVDLK